MKMARIFTILIVFVLAVFCLNGPLALGGDEHPWDEEGGGGGGLDGSAPDSGTLPTDGSGVSSAVTTPTAKDTFVLLTNVVKITFVITTIK